MEKNVASAIFFFLRGEKMKTIIELYNYREMLYNLVKKDLRTRYKGSVLGFLWTFVNPLLQLIVYSAVFSIIMRVNVDNYSIYLFVALIPWLFFATSIQVSCSSIISNKDLIKKVYFPRAIIPLSVASSAFMNMLFTMVIVLISLVVSGIGLSQYLAFLPVLMILEYFMVIGMCLIFSALNVYFRDLEHILSIVMMAWFYLTPIVYTMEMIPQELMFVFKLNPMTPLIVAFRDILYYKQMPNFNSISINILYSLILIVFGNIIFDKLQKGFAEEL